MPTKLGKIVGTLVVLAALGLVLHEFIWKWGFCYQWVPHGYSLALNKKTGKPATAERWADEAKGEAGNVERMLGPGRQFVSPWDYDTRLVEDIFVPPGKVLVVETLLGERRAEGQVLAEPHQQGIQRAVQTPGLWRNNPQGTRAGRDKMVDATLVRPGYVGVIRRQVEPNKGIDMDRVLPPGLYYNNPVEIEIIPIEVGYTVWETHAEHDVVELNGKRNLKLKPGTGFSVNLADGKPMIFDMTVVYGLWPEDAPFVVKEYGTADMVESNIVIPQVYSNTQNIASNYTTRQMIEGTTREEFQEKVTKKLQEIGKEKRIHFRFVLVRDFHPSPDIVSTIQEARLAEELKTTLKVEQERDTVNAELTNASMSVDNRLADFNAETEMLVETERQGAVNRSAQIRAEADQKAAEIMKEAALVEAQITRIAGEAEARVIEADRLADAKSDQLMVTAYGSPEAYNRAVFAEGLPSTLRIDYTYAGPGTLYTNLPEHALPNVAARQILSTQPARKR